MAVTTKQFVEKDIPLAQVIDTELGENVFLCYQCSRCSSGCPLAEHMDLMPNQIMYGAQLNDERVLSSKTIWLCASCQTCTTRCPQDLDVAAIMDTLRIGAKMRTAVRRWATRYLTGGLGTRQDGGTTRTRG